MTRTDRQMPPHHLPLAPDEPVVRVIPTLFPSRIHSDPETGNDEQ